MYKKIIKTLLSLTIIFCGFVGYLPMDFFATEAVTTENVENTEEVTTENIEEEITSTENIEEEMISTENVEEDDGVREKGDISQIAPFSLEEGGTGCSNTQTNCYTVESIIAHPTSVDVAIRRDGVPHTQYRWMYVIYTDNPGSENLNDYYLHRFV